MNKEKLEEALKVVKEPITVNSIEYKYFDIENYNKLVNVIDYCNYLNANVKPYVEAQDKEIERLHSIIKEAKDFIANNSTISGTFGKNGKMIVENIEEIHNGMRLFDILDKAGSDKE